MSQLKYSIWLMPIENDRNHLNRIIKSLAKNYDSIIFEPHCTLFSPCFEVEAAKSILNQLDIKQFETNVNRIDQSYSVRKTIFFELESDPRLILLNYLLGQAISEKYNFEPHLSLIYKKISKIERIRIIQSIPLIPKICFDRIAIVNTTGSVSEWTCEYEIQL